MLKAGVVGLGYLGKFHAEKYNLNENTKLQGVYDIDFEKAINLAKDLNTVAYKDINALYEDIDLVSIVTPATAHFEACKLALNRNIKVLVEKPFMPNLEEAKYIFELAKEKNILVSVGFIERFNIAFQKAKNIILNPSFADFYRLGTYNSRAGDVSVVFDLMIHDIDLMLNLFNDEIVNIEASGARIITDMIDYAKAKIVFKNNSIVNLTASRVLETGLRVASIKDDNNFIKIDFQNPEINILNLKNKDIKQEKYSKNDSLYDEISSFIEAENIFNKDLFNSIKTIDIANIISNLISSNLK